MYQEKTLICKECGKEFPFTAGEQEFYEEKGFNNPPKRCKDCRRMGKRPVAYIGVCAACGKEARLPFEPREERPVYCSECYAQMRAEYAEKRR
ncbi:zinc-ribbon domain containing protein [Acutalibacter intestini]|uniref:zinc-ribbon domain containing protein n=1 Tax=Acutalibacter intestini TaxID=3093659 RepID=UPI002AC92422|nr:zinc-ribbon domain containing protein [Acutalibacter sp. M00204]